MKSTIKIIGIIVLAVLVMFTSIACSRLSSAPAASSVFGSQADSYITDLEKTMEEFTAISEKLLSGDTSVMNQLDQITGKLGAIMEAGGKIADSDFTAEQKKRLESLTNKLGL